MNGKFTINAGVRYEYLSPYWEANNHLVNLDANADFTAVAPVLAGQTGPVHGPLPDERRRSGPQQPRAAHRASRGG